MGDILECYQLAPSLKEEDVFKRFINADVVQVMVCFDSFQFALWLGSDDITKTIGLNRTDVYNEIYVLGETSLILHQCSELWI